MPAAALEISDLLVRYGPRTVVDGLSLTAESGRVTAVLGPNGAGKTTTIECAEGLRRPTGGTIRVLGHAPGSPAARRCTGVMLQDGGLPLGRTAGEVVALAAALHPGTLSGPELLERLGLTAVARTPVRRLSGGQRQRLAFAVALCPQPDLLFLDEPSAGLDPHGRREVWDLVRERRSAGSAVVLTTHLLEEAQELSPTWCTSSWRGASWRVAARSSSSPVTRVPTRSASCSPDPSTSARSVRWRSGSRRAASSATRRPTWCGA
ncbi:ABC transporter ATP-binding protein [Salana multivorans]